MVNRMLVLSETDVKKCLRIDDCLEANKRAFKAIANRTAIVPTRIGLPFNDGASDTPDWSLFKPAASPSDNLMGMKVVSLRAQNPSRGLPLVGASILHMNPTTGIVEALVAGSYITGLRTACGSALSCQVMKPEAQRIVCFGAGLQAELHILAISTALGRPLEAVIVNRNQERAQALKSKMEQEHPDMIVKIDVLALCDSNAIEIALATTDVIVTCTNTTTPLFDGSWVSSGTHICGVGSYTPEMQEISQDLVNRCFVAMDTPEAKDVGDLKHLGPNHPTILVGSILNDTGGIEKSEDFKERDANLDCTFYKSVGTAIQDVMTTDAVVQKARSMGIGVEFDMT